MSHRALVGFRRLLRSSRIAFEGHKEALDGARMELRTNFLNNSKENNAEVLGNTGASCSYFHRQD